MPLFFIAFAVLVAACIITEKDKISFLYMILTFFDIAVIEFISTWLLCITILSNEKISNDDKEKYVLCCFIIFIFNIVEKLILYYKNLKHDEKNNNIISFFELNTYSQSLTNYIRLCFPPKKWNKDAERITESMMQYILTVKNPQSKEAFLKACLEMSEDLSGYPLSHKSYACNPVCKNLQSIPEEKLHSAFQEIHSILRERKENYEI